MHRVYPGRVQRVIDANTLDVLLDLGLGTFVRRHIQVEGVRIGGSPDKNASHCLVILAGGKDVLCAVYRERSDGVLTARVYAPDHTPTNPPVDLVRVEDVTHAAVDVGAWMSWIAARGFDPRLLRQSLK